MTAHLVSPTLGRTRQRRRRDPARRSQAAMAWVALRRASCALCGARERLARGTRTGHAPASLQDKEPQGISKGLTAEQQTRPPVQGETPPYPAAPGCESRHDTGGPCRRSVVAGSAGVQWHDGRRAAPSLDQTVRGVAPRLLAPLVVSQGCTVTSRLCKSLGAGYRALSSSVRYMVAIYPPNRASAGVGAGNAFVAGARLSSTRSGLVARDASTRLCR